jgi:hypothetical protein
MGMVPARSDQSGVAFSQLSVNGLHFSDQANTAKIFKTYGLRSNLLCIV